MARPAEKMIYGLSQSLRASWFMGQYVLAARLAPPVNAPPPDGPLPGWRAIIDDLSALFQRDWENIEAGLYNRPYDLMPQPLRGLSQSARFFRDLPSVQRRRRARISSEVNQAPHKGRLPRYYLQNFHFQTDGYLSDESAQLYDYQVEILFSGGADAMRRQALVPMIDYLRANGARRTRMLDVACGTGRFLTFVKDNYPRLDITALDLSESYLRRARKDLARWSRTRFVQAKAEAIPLPDGSIDLMTCIFLFHELPKKVRRQVAAEMARVLAPGGRLVFIDSIQRGDAPGYDALLDRFPIAFHEPYYKDYVREDLTALFAEAGLRTVTVQRAFFSRVMVLEGA